MDFATELDAEVGLEVKAPSLANVLAWRGESIPAEAEGRVRDGRPQALTSRHIPGAGTHTGVIPAQGFRFVHIECHDLDGPIRVNKIAARAIWTFVKRDGKMLGRTFQRVWQTSAYTARLCTRPDTYWGGIKRDRHGWGAARNASRSATERLSSFGYN